MDKNKKNLIRGIFLLIIIISFVGNNSEVLFGDLYTTGRTSMKLEVMSEIDTDKIIEIIS